MSLKLSKRQQGCSTLKPRYYNAQENPIPLSISPRKFQHVAIPIIGKHNQDQLVPSHDAFEDGKKREIDGFYLLEVSGISFPEDLQHVVLNDRKLQTVVDDDLTYFSELLYLDVSENFLPLYPFGALPKLRELRIACNRIKHIDELLGFNQLMYLDMSYNQLNHFSIQSLYDLPMLKELDLSGNALKALPADLSRFESLEKLILQYNKFDDNSLFVAFASMPVLRFLDVSNNYFSSFPKEGLEDGFKFLDTMDISFNFFGSEGDIEPIVYLTRLETLLLYGNPVLGPTGEDPMYVYIEDVVDKANQHRDEIQSTISYIDFVTEIPKRRVLKKGQPLGRLALYRDFSMVQVDGRISDRSNRDWRRKGIQTIFGEMMAGRRAQPSTSNLLPSSSSQVLVPDYTFLTNSIAMGDGLSAYHKLQQQQMRDGVGLGMSTSASQILTGNPQGMNTALNEADRNAIADSVMRKVVKEMGLTGEEDLRAFESYARMPVTVVEAELRRAITEENAEPELTGEQKEEQFLRHLDTSSVTSGRSSIFLHRYSRQFSPEAISPLIEEMNKESAAQFSPQPAGPTDHLPINLFQPSNIVQPLPPAIGLAAQPVALKTAMKALQRALDQPLTNYDSIPSRAADDKDLARHTTTTKLRQLPRIPLSSGTMKQLTDGQQPPTSKPTTAQATAGNILGGGSIKPSRRRAAPQASSGQRGLAEPLQLKKLREENRDKTLAQIDLVLQGLNQSTQQVAMLDSFPVEGSEEGTGGIAQVKQSMDKMRYFAQPQGAKHLQKMERVMGRDFQS